MELAGRTKLGRGESSVRANEWRKAAKRVRLGILAKQKERARTELVDAKNLGNYHPAFKKMYRTSTDTTALGKKRDRGLKMGVGRFQGGILKLSREEISSVERTGGNSKSRRKG